jgi:hypothetical protein
MTLLYKRLPSEFVDRLLDGYILFRNLVHFKKIESDPRADLHEGTHVDTGAPGETTRLTDLTTGAVLEGWYAYNRLKKPELVYCFCTSYSPSLTKFGKACVEIHDTATFTYRLRSALARRNALSPLEKPFLLARAVDYYGFDKAAPSWADIQDPRHLPFLKRQRFFDETEFRFVFARRGGFEQRKVPQYEQLYVSREHNELDDIRNKVDHSITINTGPIRDIARQIE